MRHFVALACLMSLILNLVEANPIESVSSSPSAPESAPEEVAEGSKMSKFLDDFTSAFKQGTAKMKESLENAASSVKDGVLQGYDYVRSKLTGDRTVTEEPVPVDQDPVADTEDPDVTPISSTQAAGLTSSLKPSPSTPAAAAAAAARPSSSSGEPEQEQVPFGGSGLTTVPVGTAFGQPAKIVPNDDSADDDRIFFNDKDLEETLAEGEREGTEQPAGITTTTPTVDNRFILAGPLACKTGQEAVNGKCRNVF
uniref:Putative secreted mucin n=1 Tax=Anopheles marajoara TaxID=58244 RepID=A0A2M4BXV4_9DIPT